MYIFILIIIYHPYIHIYFKNNLSSNTSYYMYIYVKRLRAILDVGPGSYSLLFVVGDVGPDSYSLLLVVGDVGPGSYSLLLLLVGQT